jgi:Zn-dependent M28 family amino/carboxypeptidase
VTSELIRAGYSVQLEEWSHGEYSDQNLIAKKPGLIKPEQEIYFIAHLDGMKKTDGERYPAADDNGSGVVDLLELARVLGGQTFDLTAVLFFSTGEEQGSLGVKSHLSQLSPEELKTIKYVVNIDMIGYDSDQDGVMQLFHGGQSSAEALTDDIKETILKYGLGLTPMVLKGCP